MPTDKQPTHGGARKGAGRKPAGRRPYRVRMRPSAMAALRKQAKAGGHAHVGELMESLAGSPKTVPPARGLG